ncbi:hypothetical protein JW877_04030 [bacterium]|nr:hypothetical protein [bacterium]
MKLKFCLLIFAFISIGVYCYGQGFSSACYDSQKVQLILSFKNNNKALPFTTFEDWGAAERDTLLLREEFNWFIKTGKGKNLDDAQLMAYLGREKEALHLKQQWDAQQKRRMQRFILGIPAGIAMMIGSSYWLNSIFQREDVGNLEKSGAALLMCGGIGTIIGSSIQLLFSRERSPTDHYLTATQSIEMVDRYNRTLKLKCSNIPD